MNQYEPYASLALTKLLYENGLIGLVAHTEMKLSLMIMSLSPVMILHAQI